MASPLSFPFRLGPDGRPRVADDPDRHLRELLEMVLFTAPGERVCQPEFGVGLNRVLFEGLSELALPAIEVRITQGLKRDMPPEFQLERVVISPEPASGDLVLQLRWRRRGAGSAQITAVRL